MRLWTKMAMAIVALIIVIMSIVTYFSTLRNIHAQREEFRMNMSRIAHQIASIRFAETEGWYIYQNWIDNIIASRVGDELVYIAIFDEKDSLAASTLNRRWLDLGNTTYFTAEEQVEIVSRLVSGQIEEVSKKDFDHVSINIKYGNDYLGMVDVGFSLIEINNRVRHRLMINLALLVLFSLIGVFAAVMISHRITRPLNTLSGAILKVAQGDLNQKVTMSNRDEIGQLGDAFNTMVVGLQEKSSMEEFSRTLLFTYDLDKLLQRIITHIARALDATRGLLVVFDQKNTSLSMLQSAGYPESTIPTASEIAAFSSMAPQLTGRTMVMLQDLAPRIAMPQESGWPGETWLIPIHSERALLGLVILDSIRHRTHPYSQPNLFVATLLGQAALALENVLLLQELKKQERLKKELEIAREVQQRLLPAENPHLTNVDLSGICIPAEEVGGDYFDFIHLPEDRVGIVIADVSGKGISAAFYMAEIKGMITTLAQIYQSPREVVLRLNEKLYFKVDRRIFATMIYGILDTRTGRFDFVRSGHIALVVKHHRLPVEFLIPAGIGLGLVSNDLFIESLEQKTIFLEPSDFLVFCTDGITEAMNRDKSEFGEDRLRDLLTRSDSSDVVALQKMILKELQDFVQEAPQHDDVTLVLAQLLKREDGR